MARTSRFWKCARSMVVIPPAAEVAAPGPAADSVGCAAEMDDEELSYRLEAVAGD